MKINCYTLTQNRNHRVKIKRTGVVELHGANKFNTSEKIYELMKEVRYRELAEEKVWVLGLASDLSAIGLFEVSTGTINSCLCSAREILVRALVSGSFGIVVVHNHPSFNPEPSKEDMKTARKLEVACSLVGLKLIDFLIVGNGYVSFKQRGLTGG